MCAVATALRNLAIDQRNKELIGKYALRDLIQKLPSGNNQHDQGTSDDTIAAVLATLNEVIKKNAEFSRSLLDAGGVERLMNITKQRQKYTPRVLKFAGKSDLLFRVSFIVNSGMVSEKKLSKLIQYTHAWGQIESHPLGFCSFLLPYYVFAEKKFRDISVRVVRIVWNAEKLDF